MTPSAVIVCTCSCKEEEVLLICHEYYCRRIWFRCRGRQRHVVIPNCFNFVFNIRGSLLPGVFKKRKIIIIMKNDIRPQNDNRSLTGQVHALKDDLCICLCLVGIHFYNGSSSCRQYWHMLKLHCHTLQSDTRLHLSLTTHTYLNVHSPRGSFNTALACTHYYLPHSYSI